MSSRKRAACGRTSGVRWKARVGVEIGVAVEAGHAEALLGDLAVLGLIELLLRERREQSRSPSICTGVTMPFISS